MQRIAPAELDARRTFARRRLSRRSLYAPYFGYQLSIDQNEKLRAYFAGVDACSRYVVFLFAAPSKNAITLYNQGYRFVLINFFDWYLLTTFIIVSMLSSVRLILVRSCFTRVVKSK
jgi:hypothetical protein